MHVAGDLVREIISFLTKIQTPRRAHPFRGANFIGAKGDHMFA